MATGSKPSSFPGTPGPLATQEGEAGPPQAPPPTLLATTTPATAKGGNMSLLSRLPFGHSLKDSKSEPSLVGEAPKEPKLVSSAGTSGHTYPLVEMKPHAPAKALSTATTTNVGPESGSIQALKEKMQAFPSTCWPLSPQREELALGRPFLHSPPPMKPLSPVRSRSRPVETLVEEDATSEESEATVGNICSPVRPPEDQVSSSSRQYPRLSRRSDLFSSRASLHYGVPGGGGGAGPHERKKLFRRSSFNVDIMSPGTLAHMYIPVLPVKPPEPVPQPTTVHTRRCSLTLPYPNLYGSWQSSQPIPAAVAAAVAKSASHDIPLSTCPPPLLKRRSMAHMDLSRLTFSGMGFGQPSLPPAAATTTTTPAPASGAPGPDSSSSSSAPPGTANSRMAFSPMTPVAPVTPVTPTHPLLANSEGSRDEGEEEIHLLVCNLQRVPMKDFGSEVRATLDVAHFLNQAVFLLDVTETSLEGVVDIMLHRLLDTEDPPIPIQEAKSVLFTSDSVHILSRTIQGTCCRDGASFDYDQSWICALCNLPSLQHRLVAITRFKHPANFGRTSHEVKLFVLVLCPSKEKGTKNALETGRTFATIFADMDFRQKLLEATTEEDFKRLILKQAQELAEEQSNPEKRMVDSNHTNVADYEYEEKLCQFGKGIRDDLQRRLPVYLSDYRDGFVGRNTPHKVISTTFFLYFACILPAIAFGVLNDHNTKGMIDVKKVIVGQTIGGLFYVSFAGQPLLILLTTAPLALYIKIIYSICEDFHIDFYAMYCCVGLWNTLFLVLYALFDVSRLMRWSTRSTEEIFALFISIAFFVDAFRDVAKNFQDNYNNASCQEGLEGGNSSHHLLGGLPSPAPSLAPTALALLVNASASTMAAVELLNGSSSSMAPPLASPGHSATENIMRACRRESSILFILLMLGTLWLGVSLYNFNKTPYLQASKREALADYSLPVAVLLLSFVGSYVFRDVELERFRYDDKDVFHFAPLHMLSVASIFAAMGLGFSLSLLFFMDQNITSAMVNNPCNKLKKGPAYHWDLFVVALLNGFLSLFALPWMHATLPHSPLHVRGLADVEERVEQGHVYEIIVKVRETRVTGMISHLLIGMSFFLLPYPMAYIPTAVLDGLFLYMAVTALNGNQMFERITLLFMEQAAYPPNHYIRRVPQRKIHQFTGCQVLQLCAMCVFGFAPWAYVKMVFPLIILLLLPIRHRLIPLLIEEKYLAALDGEHV